MILVRSVSQSVTVLLYVYIMAIACMAADAGTGVFPPREVVVSFAPFTMQGEVFYKEHKEELPQKSHFLTIAQKKQAALEKEIGDSIFQYDTLKYRVKSQYGGEWSDDSTWKISKVKILGNEISGSDDRKLKTDGKFISVIFEVSNDGKQSQYIRVPSLVDLLGRKYEIIDDSDEYISKEFVFRDLNELKAGFSKKYCAIYEVPGNAKELKLVIYTLESFSLRGTFLPIGSRPITIDMQSVNNNEALKN